MSIFAEGPSGVEIDWEQLLVYMAHIAAVEENSSIGASVQQAGDRPTAMEDQLVGKLGPMIGKWDPEKGNRMVQEF